MYMYAYMRLCNCFFFFFRVSLIVYMHEVFQAYPHFSKHLIVFVVVLVGFLSEIDGNLCQGDKCAAVRQSDKMQKTVDTFDLVHKTGLPPLCL